MNKAFSVNRFPVLLAVNAVPLAIWILLFWSGAGVDLLLFLPVFVAMTVLNYRSCQKAGPYFLIQTVMLICVLAAGCASTSLYYSFVSSDEMTPPVGMLITFVEMAIVTVTTALTGLVKCLHKKATHQRIMNRQFT